MLNRIILVVILVPLAVILIALAVANRNPVLFTLDPFNPGNPAFSLQLPLFVFMLLAVMLGVLIGSTATWLRQSRYRRAAKQQKKEVERLHVASHQQAQANGLVRTDI